jgi:hypothetical protein
MADGVVDIGTGIATSIGRYFSVVSFIPSAIYVLYVYLLIASGSWHHPPDWDAAVVSLGHLGLTGIAALVLSSVALGLLIHPIQFALVQFFEGYWGTWPVPQVLRRQRIVRYQERFQKLKTKKRTPHNLEARWRLAGYEPTSLSLVPVHSEFEEADRVLSSFPKKIDEVMPTRLGNVLRRTESETGSQYGLDALQAVQHLLLIAPAAHVDYVNDQRSQLDLAVRMTFMSAVAVVTTLLFLCMDRFWTLLAIVPYGLTYLSYRGSVVAATHYAAAIDVLVNLNRFALYQQLHLPVPANAAEEKAMNEALAEVLRHEPVFMRYEHPAAISGATEK